jgi:hypothetical protein
MKRIMIEPNCCKSIGGMTDMLRKISFVVLVCALALAVSPAIYAQATGSISGNILDKSGSAVPVATVTITSLGTGLTRAEKADGSGHYLIPLLPVGNYNVHVDATGFQSAESKDLNLQGEQARELDFNLVPASVSTTVTVVGNAVAIETANASLGQVITGQQVSQLPLNGRDFVQLATLTAGATAETNPNSFFNSTAADSEVAARGSFSLSVGGSRPNSTDWLLDGVDNNELTSGGIGVFSSIDDIAEFKVLTYSYSAEFGTRAGPTVLVTSKSGTNDFHGSLYEFVRNTDLDAKGDFDTTTPKFNLNQFGGSLGGPIRHNKMFFFIDGEQKYQREGITFTGLVPSLAMRNGDFSADPFGNPVVNSLNQPTLAIANPNTVGPTFNPNVYFQCNAAGNPLPANPDGSQDPGTPCNKIPSNLINTAGQALLNIYPAPNASNPNYNFVNEPVRVLNETKFDVRLDDTLTASDNVFARFSYDQAFTFAPGGAATLAESNAFGSNENLINHARNIGLGWSHVFSATTVNQATFGYDRIFDYIASLGNFTCESAILGIPNADLGCSPSGTPLAGGSFSQGLVSIEPTSGYWSLGDRGFSPFQGGTNIFSFKDDLDLIRGKHEIHTGIDLRANQMNVGSEAFSSGFLLPGTLGNFSGYTCPKNAMMTGPGACVNAPGNPEADLLMGISGGAIHDQTYDGATTGRRWKIIRPFVEDDWRVVPSLTLNLGLAWDITTPITEIHNRMADYIPSTGQLLIAGQNGVSRSAGINMFWGAYEPRVGLAWKVLGSDKTVLRAGFGIYHDSAWSQGAQGLWENPPNLGESDQFASAGCAFATSYCALTLGQTPSGTFDLSTGFASLPTPQSVSTFQGSFYYERPNTQPGRVHQYNVNVERQLPGDVLVTAGYAGATGGHILVSGNDLNVNSPSDCGTVPGYTLGCLPGGAPYIAPYNIPFNPILFFGDVGQTHYNSLQLKAETKTPKHGLYALIAYTYSRTYDNGLTDGLGSELSAPYFPLPNWQKLDWSLSQINLNHSLTGSFIYDLPFGKGKMVGSNWNNAANTLLGNWQITLIERVSSGFPVPLIDSSNQSGTAFNAGGNSNNFNRPDQTPGCNPYAANHSQFQWINPVCFSAPMPGKLGDAARVPVSGPDFVNSDASLIKQFRLPHNMGLNFRAEFFNLFNHPQYGSPIADINFNSPPADTVSSSFGKVDSTVNNPRLMQLALKLTF